MGKSEYEVEKIISKKLEAKKKFYLVKWKGYSNSSNTWEPEENLITCKKMVEDFQKKEPSTDNKIGQNKPEASTPKNKYMIDSATKKANQNEKKSIEKPNKRSMQEQFDAVQQQKIQEMKKQTLQGMNKKPWGVGKERQSLQIEGLYVDINMNYWFNVMLSGKKETISREQLIERNFMALIEFYESHMKFDNPAARQ